MFFQDNNLDNLELLQEDNPNSNQKVKKKIARRYSELNKDSSKVEGIGTERNDTPETF